MSDGLVNILLVISAMGWAVAIGIALRLVFVQQQLAESRAHEVSLLRGVMEQRAGSAAPSGGEGRCGCDRSGGN